MLLYAMMIDSQEDQSKFERLYKRYRNLMFTSADKILNNKHDSEDALHQAFLKVAEHIETIDDSIEPRVRGLLVTIAENKAIDIYRKKKRRARIELEEAYGLTIEYHGSNDLTACMINLPAIYREVLLLKSEYGYSAKEIASILDLTEANVHKIHQRAKKKLYEEYYGKEYK